MNCSTHSRISRSERKRGESNLFLCFSMFCLLGLIGEVVALITGVLPIRTEHDPFYAFLLVFITLYFVVAFIGASIWLRRKAKKIEGKPKYRESLIVNPGGSG